MSFKFVVLSIFLFLPISSDIGQTRRTHAPSPARSSTLSIKAGVIFKSGDVKPVARTTFYLLDEDLRTILDRAFSPPQSFEQNLEKLALISQLSGGDPIEDQEEIKNHVVAKTTTDFGGTARFTSIRSGSRFLFGMYRTSYTVVVWHLPIQVGQVRSLTLDNKNAVYIGNK